MLNKLLPLKPLSLSAALALATVGSASFLPAAEAALFNFSYTPHSAPSTVTWAVPIERLE